METLSPISGGQKSKLKVSEALVPSGAPREHLSRQISQLLVVTSRPQCSRAGGGSPPALASGGCASEFLLLFQERQSLDQGPNPLSSSGVFPS